MIFNDAFDIVLGGVLLGVMLLLLGGFSICINSLITKDPKTTLVEPSETKEYSDMRLSDLDSTMKDTTIVSTVPLGTSINTSVQSAPVNIGELRRKKQQERRSSQQINIGLLRLTSSPKPKSKLAVASPRLSPSSRLDTSSKPTPLNPSINRSLVSPMLQKCYDRINASLEWKHDLKSPIKHD